MQAPVNGPAQPESVLPESAKLTPVEAAAAAPERDVQPWTREQHYTSSRQQALPDTFEVHGVAYIANSDLPRLNAERTKQPWAPAFETLREATDFCLLSANSIAAAPAFVRYLKFAAHELRIPAGSSEAPSRGWQPLQWLRMYGIPIHPDTARFEKFHDAYTHAGRWNQVVPLGMLESVQHPSRAPEPHSLYSLTFLKQQQFRPGCKVDVLRNSRDELVEVVGRNPDAPDNGQPLFDMPASCPACGCPLRAGHPRYRSSHVRDGRYNEFGDTPDDTPWWCPSSACTAQAEALLSYYVKRCVPGCGRGTAAQLVSAGLVRTLPDLYNLMEEQARSLLKGIIRFARYRRQRDCPALEQVAEWLAHPHHKQLLADLHGLGVGQGPDQAATKTAKAQGQQAIAQPLLYLNVTFTGAFQQTSEGSTRTELEAKAEAAGARIDGIATETTNVVVTGAEPEQQDLATRFKVEVLDVDQFWTKYGRPGIPP
ncbi:hypothetical protein WJX72_008348 [[Myrmecia] bisecta]|uniref:BRCT domain-containing protein n=1 Tax=[Myrmecia] bisecta TaxID=41462 RepID=A0AAW1QB25_9CHLO